ncbi:MAG: bis(5'-nucleosyl)-tetraphosphatase (symmetrical) YqeK [Sphaerochaeta sp.]|nr:bis(5'-nucleosyl)-tetraphosphatase (symmetrical) YqeK [Sphaerochaeta sp.]
MSSRTGSIALERELPSLMSEKRFLHSKATAESSLSLVLQYGEQLDRELCIQASLLHDIARQWGDEQLLSYAKEHCLPLEAEEKGDPVLLHAPVGAHLLAERGYESSLCLAVRYHTLGSVHMGRLGLVLFIADYIEPRRTHITDTTRKSLRLLPSLEMVCVEILRMQGRYLHTQGKKPARCSEELKRHLLAGKRL